jgi:hypothetical protein
LPAEIQQHQKHMPAYFRIHRFACAFTQTAEVVLVLQPRLFEQTNDIEEYAASQSYVYSANSLILHGNIGSDRKVPAVVLKY